MSHFAPRNPRPFAERKAINKIQINRNIDCETCTMLGNIFDPKAELLISSGVRPHWSQAGAVVFITARLHDSIPITVLERWEREKQDWMLRRGQHAHWSLVLPTLDDKDQNTFRKHFNRCREDLLDEGLGSCVLGDPGIAAIVAKSLMHFDGERYRMGDFMIMPNHFHLLATFPTEIAMREQCDSWLHYTAVHINRRMGTQGKLWQQEPFDHLVRSPEQYEYLRKYIADNAAKAGLPTGSFLYRRYPDHWPN